MKLQLTFFDQSNLDSMLQFREDLHPKEWAGKSITIGF